MNDRKDRLMNRRAVAAAPALAAVLALSATACGSPSTGGGSDFVSWSNVTQTLCQEQKVAWSAGLATALTGLFAVQWKPGFTPVPSDSRATDFADAIAGMSNADVAWARSQTDSTAADWNHAKAEVVRAAGAINSPSCVALATGASATLAGR
jgi:hypothetical protein